MKNTLYIKKITENDLILHLVGGCGVLRISPSLVNVAYKQFGRTLIVIILLPFSHFLFTQSHNSFLSH